MTYFVNKSPTTPFIFFKFVMICSSEKRVLIIVPKRLTLFYSNTPISKRWSFDQIHNNKKVNKQDFL